MSKGIFWKLVDVVFKWHFDKIQLLVILNSLHVEKYFDKILGDLAPSSRGHVGSIGCQNFSNWSVFIKHILDIKWSETITHVTLL